MSTQLGMINLISHMKNESIIKPDISPIFIIGSPRSGTSIMCLALKEGAGIPGYNEGHLAPLFAQIVNITNNYYQSRQGMIGNKEHLLTFVDQSFMLNELTGLFTSIYSRAHSKPHFFEKTGNAEMIRACPTLQSIWSNSKFIFAKRRGIENIQSRIRKFPDINFTDHCIAWSKCMNDWLLVRESINDKLEIDQLDIALRPEFCAQQISDFLNLDSIQADNIKTIFASKRPQKTEEQQITDHCHTFNETGWTDEQINIFNKHCNGAMAAYNYVPG